MLIASHIAEALARATATTMSDIAIAEALDGKSVDWMEKRSAKYNTAADGRRRGRYLCCRRAAAMLEAPSRRRARARKLRHLVLVERCARSVNMKGFVAQHRPTDAEVQPH